MVSKGACGRTTVEEVLKATVSDTDIMFSEHDPTIQDIPEQWAITPERLETLLNKREEEECLSF